MGNSTQIITISVAKFAFRQSNDWRLRI